MRLLILGAVALVMTRTTAKADDWQKMATALVACAAYQSAMADWQRPFDANEAETRHRLSIQFTGAAWIARVLYLVETGHAEDDAHQIAENWTHASRRDRALAYARALRAEGDAAPRFADTEHGCGVLLSYAFKLKRELLDE